MKGLQQSDPNDTSNNVEFQNSNVSEPERAEEALAREILHNTGNLVLLKDADGRYLFVNRQFERAFHVRREEIKGKKDEEIFPPEQAAAFRANDVEGSSVRIPSAPPFGAPVWTAMCWRSKLQRDGTPISMAPRGLGQRSLRWSTGIAPPRHRRVP